MCPLLLSEMHGKFSVLIRFDGEQKTVSFFHARFRIWLHKKLIFNGLVDFFPLQRYAISPHFPAWKKPSKADPKLFS